MREATDTRPSKDLLMSEFYLLSLRILSNISEAAAIPSGEAYALYRANEELLRACIAKGSIELSIKSIYKSLSPPLEKGVTFLLAFTLPLVVRLMTRLFYICADEFLVSEPLLSIDLCLTLLAASTYSIRSESLSFYMPMSLSRPGSRNCFNYSLMSGS
jgi:hypothetical protein